MAKFNGVLGSNCRIRINVRDKVTFGVKDRLRVQDKVNNVIKGFKNGNMN